MITPREIDCPNCGKPNEYSLGSCRKCGLPREEFDKIEQNEEILSKLGESLAAKSAARQGILA
jgi:rubredoxin